MEVWVNEIRKGGDHNQLCLQVSTLVRMEPIFLGTRNLHKIISLKAVPLEWSEKLGIPTPNLQLVVEDCGGLETQ